MQLGLGSLAGLARLRDYKSRRVSSWDRSGGNRDFVPIAPGETRVLGEIAGAGCIKHIWMTLMTLPEPTTSAAPVLGLLGRRGVAQRRGAARRLLRHRLGLRATSSRCRCR